MLDSIDPQAESFEASVLAMATPVESLVDEKFGTSVQNKLQVERSRAELVI